MPTEDGKPVGLPQNGGDNWKHRSDNMRCRTCMFFVKKYRSVRYDDDGTLLPTDDFGRCRKNAPTMNGFPAVWGTDWCGNHKIDENKI